MAAEAKAGKPRGKTASNAVRITREAIEAARIAAAFKGLTVSEYVSGVVLARALKDVDEGYRRLGSRGGKP